MAEKMKKLARLAVAAGQWRWVPGMLTLCGRRVVEVEGSHIRAYSIHDDPFEEMLPDLDDDATLGCLLGLVRDVRGCQNAHAYIEPEPWRWEVITADLAGRPIGAGDTYAEALLNALELYDNGWYADEEVNHG